VAPVVMARQLVAVRSCSTVDAMVLSLSQTQSNTSTHDAITGNRDNIFILTDMLASCQGKFINLM